MECSLEILVLVVLLGSGARIWPLRWTLETNPRINQNNRICLFRCRYVGACQGSSRESGGVVGKLSSQE